MPVAGLLQPTASREQVAVAVPAKGPVARMSGLPGASASVPGGEFLEEVAEQKSLAADVQAGPVCVERLDARREGGQVEPQDASGVEVQQCSSVGVGPGPWSARGPRATMSRH